MPKSDVVYLYMMGVAGGPSKIGYATAPVTRMKAIQRETAGTVTLLGEWPVGAAKALATERYVHWLLREHHFRGEWFNVSQERAALAINAALASLVDERNPIPPLEAPGRELRYGQHMANKFQAGTFERVAAVLAEGEDRTDFVREAVERELKRRERQKPDKQ